MVVNEPSIVAIHQADHSVLAVGHEAKAMLGRAPGNIVAIRQLKDGVIADFDVTEKMLHYSISKVHRRRTLVRPRIVIGVPSGITQVEKRAVRDSAMQAGAREVYLIEEPMAAAIGAGLPIQEPGGNMIVDIGGGTTEVAVISLSGIVYAKSVRIAGDEMDEAIVQYIRKHYNLLVGERRAEEIKVTLGSAYPMGGERRTMEVKGRDLIDGIPKTIVITDEEIREALREPVMTIVETVRTCLERTPPELAADIVDKGIVITGGGALLLGLDHLLRQETNLPETQGLRVEALRVGETTDENRRLRRLLAFQERLPLKTLSGEVIARDWGGWIRSLTVNRGRGDHVPRLAAVISPEGLIGRFVDVRPGASIVQVLTDPASTVGAHVVRTRASGIVEGDPRGTLRFKYMARGGTGIEVGDILVTSGQGALFPRGIPIGRVRRIGDPGSALFYYAVLEPAVNFARVDEVLLVTGDTRHDLATYFPTDD